MNIGIDARWIFPQLSGIGLHTRELIRHLALLDNPGPHHYTLFFQHEDVMRELQQTPELQNHPAFSYQLVPYSPFAPASQLQLPRMIRDLKLDVFHSTNWMVPFRAFPRGRQGATACLITIHDMIPMKHPEFTPRALKTRLLPIFRFLMRQVAARADRIITVSECSKRDVADLLRIPAERISVIPNGVDKRYQPGPHIAERPPVILYVGRLDPYKNVPVLVDAFSRLLKTVPDARLRIIGPDDDRYPETADKIRTLHLEPHVQRDGYLSDDGLLDAYQNAAILVLPSRYEGFGLPVAEAMACATPVTCSNTSSLPEVAGDAALTIDGNSAAELENALHTLLTQPELAARLSQAGPIQAARFDWHEVALKTRNLYAQFAG